MDIKQYYNLVEECIIDFGIDILQCRGDKEGQWDLRKGSATVWIDVFLNKDNQGYFQCMAKICPIPQENILQFYSEVLEINHKIFGGGMTKFKNYIYIKFIRELEGLDKEELVATISRIGNYADKYDDYLKNKYFGNN